MFDWPYCLKMLALTAAGALVFGFLLLLFVAWVFAKMEGRPIPPTRAELMRRRWNMDLTREPEPK